MRIARDGLPVADVTGAAGVNVVFHVPGKLMKPDYEGMRTGSWFGKRRTQVVQVAVPPDLREPGDIAEFLASSVEAAVPLAAERIARFKRSAHLSTSDAATAAAAAASSLRAEAAT